MFVQEDWVQFEGRDGLVYGQLGRELTPGWWSVDEETDHGMVERAWTLHESKLTLVSGCCGVATDDDIRFCPSCKEGV